MHTPPCLYAIRIQGRLGPTALSAFPTMVSEVKDSDTFAAAIKKVQFPMPGGGTFRFDENNNPIVNIILVQWEWKDGKANPKVLDQATDVRQVFLSK